RVCPGRRMAGEHTHDVFISYSSRDRAWAERLAQDLRERQIDVFLDADRIQLGTSWGPQLARHLTGSRHLIVLWSNAAEDSRWVPEEIGRFRQIVDPTGAGVFGDRRLLAVVLEGDNIVLHDLQMLTALRDAGAYPGGPQA